MRLSFGYYCRYLACASILVLIAAAPAKPERTPLLDPYVLPVSYDLTLQPGLPLSFRASKLVKGSETIVIDVRRPVSRVILNAAFTKISESAIDGRTAKATFYPKAQQVALSTGSVLRAGRHTLSLAFLGHQFMDVHGWWLDTMNLKTAPALVSNFELATARTLFPCFDEPQMRASFTIHTIAPAGLTAISNMPVAARVAVGAGLVRTDFEPTPPLPTYLLTIDLGKFVSASANVGETPVTVYVRPGEQKLAKSVLADATASLAFYERDLGLPYPLPKLDYVIGSGVLNDVSDGYGAITTFTEFDVSGQQQQGGLRGRRDAFSYVAGPIAKQWFGGEVGIRWWSDLFVQQSLGAYEEQRAERALHPEFSKTLGNAIDFSWMNVYDSAAGTTIARAIHDDRDSAAWDGENDRMYSLGPAVVDMWKQYVGETSMRDAIHRYLTTHAGHTATNADFWSAFHDPHASSYGKAWLYQPGTPALFVTASCSKGVERVVASQQPTHAGFSLALDDERWPIPFVISVDGRRSSFLLETKRRTLQLGPCVKHPSFNPDMRPPYIAQARGFAHPSSMTGRRRLYDDTYFLYLAHLADVVQLNRALAAFTAISDQDYDVRGGANRLRRALIALRGTAASLTLSQSVSAWAKPMLASLGVEPNAATAEEQLWLMELMSWTSDPGNAGAAAKEFARAVGPGKYSQATWGLAQLAAQSRDRALLDSMLPVPPPSNFAMLSFREMYLLNVSHAASIRRVLDSAKKKSDFAMYVSSLGRRNPSAVSAYLDAHARDVMHSVPPSQQHWTLTYAVVNGCWPARTTEQWRRFFERYIPGDEATIDDAVTKIAAKYRERERLERQITGAGQR